MTDEEIQKKQFNDFFKLCDSADLEQIKELMSNINLKSQFHQKNQSYRRFYSYACLSGNLDIVDELAPLAISCKSKKPIINEALTYLIDHNQQKSYSVISYLINTPKLEPVRSDEFYSILEQGVEDAAKADNLSLFKALMNLEDKAVDHNYIFSIQYMSILNNACYNNNIEVFKYIYDYRQLKNNHEPEYGFWKACVNKNMNILQFLIFEKNIERNEDNENTMKTFDCPEARNMFDARELSKELPSNSTITKKNKI